MKRVALIGYGYWGPNLLRNLFDTENCEVIYCCDLSENNLKKVQKRYPSVITTSELNQVLDDSSIDGVIIATPTRTHFSIAEQALKKGKDVLIEKPFTMNVSEAKKLVDLAKKEKRILMVDHTFLFNNAVLKIKDLIDSEDLGDILYIDSVRANLGLFQTDVNAIFDLASHDFSIINFLLDSKPQWVNAVGEAHYNNQEDVAYITAGYQKILVHIHVSWLSPLKIRKMLIVGSKKMLVYDDIESAEKIKIYDKGVFKQELGEQEKEQISINYRSGDALLPKIDFTEPLGVLTQTYINAIADRKEPKSSGSFILQVMEALEASTESIRTNRKVVLNAGKS